jgi:hypothetical protein
MTNNFWGYVIQANVPINEPALEKHLRLIKPELVHVLNNPTYGAHLKRNVIPDSKIFLRHYDQDGDGNDWIQYSPKDYFEKYAWETMNGALGLQICNEPGFGRDVTQRLVSFMAEGVKRGIPVAPGGFSVGSPPGTVAAWAVHDDFVKIICEHPTLLSYSAHEYWQVLPTSGMVTKDTKPGEQLYFANHLRDISEWPSNINQLTNMFHVGRCKAFVDYARSKSYGAPVIDITEHGVDDVEGGKLKEWKLSLLNGQNIRGYKPCDQQWQAWFGLPRPVTYTTMLAWIRDTIYKPLGVRGATLFTWGNSGKAGTSEDWQTFDCATDPDFQAALEKLVALPVPPPPPQPPEPPPPYIPPPDSLPNKELVDFRRLLQLDKEAKVIQAAILARDLANEADNKELDIIVREIEALLDKYHKAA